MRAIVDVLLLFVHHREKFWRRYDILFLLWAFPSLEPVLQVLLLEVEVPLEAADSCILFEFIEDSLHKLFLFLLRHGPTIVSLNHRHLPHVGFLTPRWDFLFFSHDGVPLEDVCFDLVMVLSWSSNLRLFDHYGSLHHI